MSKDHLLRYGTSLHVVIYLKRVDLQHLLRAISHPLPSSTLCSKRGTQTNTTKFLSTASGFRLRSREECPLVHGKSCDVKREDPVTDGARN